MERVFSYERVSSKQQVTGSGLGRQSGAAQEWAARHGLQLDTTLHLCDAGRSASKGDHLSKGALGRFLQLAQAGQLGTTPLLLVEAIDRLSRQEPLDAIETILSGLVGSGVRIVTLEDGSEYSRATLRSDPSKLIVLVVKIQAAYEYSARLAMRMQGSWQAHRAKLEANVNPRPRHFCPAWCEWDEQGYVVDQAKVKTIKLCFEMLRYQGASATARDLNAKGLLTPSGNRWTNGSVRNLAMNTDAVYGGLRLNSRRHHGKDAQEQLYEDVLPVVVDKAKVMAVREIMRQRGRTAEQAGPNGTMRFVGQGLTHCICGTRVGIVSSGSSEYRYLYCRHRASHNDGCRRANVPLLDATAHLLRRLEPEALLAMVEAAQASDGASGLQQRAEHLKAELAAIKTKRQNLERALVKAAEQGLAVEVLSEQLSLRQKEANTLEQELMGLEAQLAVQQDSSKSEAAAQPLAAFRQAFALGEDSSEQRRAVNRCLRELGLRIVIDGEERRMGLGLPGGPLEWQTMRPLDRRVLWAGGRLAEAGQLVQEVTEGGIAPAPESRQAAESR
jgi:DNA invertase Pin-like site-specific DNA recombinase